jgi:hypothetical protein
MAHPISRFPFSASAEVASDDSVEVTRVTELSRHVLFRNYETTDSGNASDRQNNKEGSDILKQELQCCTPDRCWVWRSLFGK